MAKILTVASEVQKAVLEQVLLAEISSGFWKNARPADHADNWKGVQIVVGTELGASGFDVPRNYNFVNPEFFPKAEAALLTAATAVDPDMTVKKLKKQLLSLNQILGARLKVVGGGITKLSRGRKTPAEPKAPSTEKAATSVKRVAVNFAEPATETA